MALPFQEEGAVVDEVEEQGQDDSQVDMKPLVFVTSAVPKTLVMTGGTAGEKNVRKAVLDVLHRLQVVLMSKAEDDVETICCLIDCYQDVLLVPKNYQRVGDAAGEGGANSLLGKKSWTRKMYIIKAYIHFK